MVRRAFIQHHQKKLLSALKIMNSKLEIIGVEDGNVVITNFYIYNVPTHENLILNNSRLKRSRTCGSILEIWVLFHTLLESKIKSRALVSKNPWNYKFS